MKECSKAWHRCKHPGDTISSKYTFHCGWKAALETVKSKIDYANAGNDMIDWIFEEELDATSEKRC